MGWYRARMQAVHGIGKRLEQMDVRNTPVSELYLSTRATNVLKKANLQTIGQVAAAWDRLMKEPCMGKVTMCEVREAMVKQGVMLPFVQKKINFRNSQESKALAERVQTRRRKSVERIFYVVRERMKGRTYADIARELGLSSARVQQMGRWRVLYARCQPYPSDILEYVKTLPICVSSVMTSAMGDRGG